MNFDFPFRLRNGEIQTVTPDTIEEIEACARLLLGTPVGSRDMLPDFGTPQVEFSNHPDLQDIESALDTWEPRLRSQVDGFFDDLDESLYHLNVTLDRQTER